MIHARFFHCVRRDCNCKDRLYLTLPSFMRVMMSASLKPSAQQIKNLECLSSLTLLRTSTRPKKPTTALGVLCPVCATCGVFLLFDRLANPHHVSQRKCCIHSNCPLSNRVTESDLNSPTSCVFHQDSQAFSRCSDSLFHTSICLNLLNCCHSCRQSQFFKLHCGQPRASTLVDHNTLECFRNVCAAP